MSCSYSKKRNRTRIITGEFDEEKLRNASSQSHLWKVSWKEAILRILDLLSNEMRTCIEEREKYLESMKTAHDRLAETLYRIQRPS